MISTQTGTVCGVARGTLIMTTRGLVPVEEVRTGELVLTGTGDWKPAQTILCGTAPTVIIRGEGREMECTGAQGIMCAAEPEQQAAPTAAENSAGRWWLTPTYAEPLPFPAPMDRTLLNENVFEIAGAYTVAGRLDGPGHVRISTSREAADRLHLALEPTTKDWTLRDKGTEAELQITDRGLAEWLRDCFGDSQRALPAWSLGLPDTWRTALWKGVLETGGRTEPDGSCEVTAPDRRTALSLLLLAQTLGLQGIMSGEAGAYIVRLHPQKSSAEQPAVWQNIESVSSGRESVVFSIGLESGTFTADGIIVCSAPKADGTVLTDEAAAAMPA